MTTPVSGALPASTPLPAAPVRPDAMGKDTFLKLLVAQLKYQNPLSPTDGTEFMAQTAQFSVVEKLDELARQNAELLSSNRALSASGLLGREVVHVAADGSDVVATVTGVRFDAPGPVLRTGETEVALAAVKEVRPARG